MIHVAVDLAIFILGALVGRFCCQEILIRIPAISRWHDRHITDGAIDRTDLLAVLVELAFAYAMLGVTNSAVLLWRMTL